MRMGKLRRLKEMFCFVRLAGIWIDGWDRLMSLSIKIGRLEYLVGFLLMLIDRLSWAILGGTMLDLLLGYKVRLLSLVGISTLSRYYYFKDSFNILERYI